MVLIFDDNEFRRKEIRRSLRDTEIAFKVESYEHWEYLTKPLVTVFVMPKPSELDYMIRNVQKQGTIPVAIVKRESPSLKHIKHLIISENGVPTPDTLREIINREYDYNLKQDLIGSILIDESDEDIYFGGKRLSLTQTEYKISRLLAYNPKKKFTDEEIIEYIGSKITTSSISKYVSYINHKCTDKYRKRLILRSSYGYKINDAKNIVTNALD